ncbi:hypothetical protein MMC26_006329 [Xylographa opegraphella]|nr:hypothetical protein [Xylographa opegraphella]
MDRVLSNSRYPAKAHAAKVASYLKSKSPSAVGIIYLEGQKTHMIEDNDEPVPFRQRRYFFYLSGCNLPDSCLTYNIHTKHLTLFIPPIDPESVIWSGLPVLPTQALKLYDVDDVRLTSEINAYLTSHDPAADSTGSCVWAIPEQVSDQSIFLAFEQKDLLGLKDAIEECRVVKDEYEIALIKKANEVSAIAHTAVLKAAKHARNERELEAIFLEKCIANGAREQAYHGIFASGTNAATLHYQKNDQELGTRLNLLLDAGAEWRCYASDVTRTFPISGRFSKESREIYDIVLRMQQECIQQLKEKVLWDDVHALAHEIAIEGLLDLGILTGRKEEIFEKRTSVAFFPHGLGHYLGMDTHDTGGHPDYKDKDRMFRYLRVRGRLPGGSIITVEPGIYFCRFILEPYLDDPVHKDHIDREILDRYWDVGGVRIEDNVLITETGYENLTTAVKVVEEMESVIDSS